MTDPPVLVDSRVGAFEASPHLKKLGIPVLVTTLRFGDFCFAGNGPSGGVLIGIERKTVSDLVNSMLTGRLSGHQLIGMLEMYNYSYLLVEGVMRANPKNGIAEVPRGRRWFPANRGERLLRKDDIDKYLHTLSVMAGVIVWHTRTIKDSAQWISGLYKWWCKDWNKHSSHLRHHRHFGTFSIRKPPLAVRVAAEFAGVGIRKANAAAKKFGSVHAFINASEKELSEVDGIGNALSKSIHREARCRK